ncbi:serine acetyltransferase [Modestobacter muralis]|uniref:Serine acetyltransferase n=1 Tax=Modestobacter muralis TaxID=1608614 RepID=A0A6P0HCM6_9ACTN|nr:serine acetyltransferase [Modestobacter muralis]NEK96440.1 serine acetyltransferase [Modestobacter muralis]NEN53340.1 serine acetyltransferase [Modestobacter muralis]
MRSAQVTGDDAPGRAHGPSVQESSLWAWTTQDWAVNAGYTDSRLVLLWYRSAQWAIAHGGFPGRVYGAVYRLLCSLFIGVELPPEAVIGPRLRLFHPHAIVVNPAVRMGADCVLRQNVTIGNVTRRDGTEKGVASLGDGVELGAGCVVVGDVHVGDHARIGALALVLESVPARGVAVGNPARVVRIDAGR